MFATTVYARYASAQPREKRKSRALQAQVFPQQKTEEKKKNIISDYEALKNRFGGRRSDLNVTCITIPHYNMISSAASKLGVEHICATAGCRYFRTPPADLATRSCPVAQPAGQATRDHQSRYCHKRPAFRVRAMHVRGQAMRVRSQSRTRGPGQAMRARSQSRRRMPRPGQASDARPQQAVSWGSPHRGQPG